MAIDEQTRDAAPFAVCETEQQAMDLARQLNPTLEQRLTELEKSVGSLRSIVTAGLIEALAEVPTETPEENEVCWLTPFGYAVRRDGKWVGVTRPNRNRRVL